MKNENHFGVNNSNPKMDELKLMFSIKELSDLKNKINSINLYNIHSHHLIDDLINEVDNLKNSCNELHDECSVYGELNNNNHLNFSL